MSQPNPQTEIKELQLQVFEYLEEMATKDLGKAKTISDAIIQGQFIGLLDYYRKKFTHE